MRKLILACAALMLLSACDGGQDPPDPDPGIATPTRVPANAGPSVGDWPTVFNSWTGGGDLPEDCEFHWDFANPPSDYIGDGTKAPVRIHLGDWRQICLTGFDTAAPITLTVERPNGKSRTTIVRRGAEATVDVPELLGPDLPAEIVLAGRETHLATSYGELPPTLLDGSYSLVAEQGGRRVTGKVQLHRGPLGDPDRTRLVPQKGEVYPHEIAEGERLNFLLLDFAPNARVGLAIYRNTGVFRQHGVNGEQGDGFDFEFAVHLPPVKVNKQGWAYHSIVIPDGLPAGTEADPDFCVVAAPKLKLPYCKPGWETTFTLRQ